MNLPSISAVGSFGEPKRHPLSVDDLTRMVAAGIIDENARIELIEGELIDMPPINAPHSGLLNRLTRIFVLATAERGVVSIQNALRLSDITLPQPDLCLLRARETDYIDRLPTVADVVLVLEVADSSLSYDRDRKMPLYARHGIPEFWLVDVNNRRVTRYSEPGADGYARSERLQGRVTLLQLPACSIDLGALFPA